VPASALGVGASTLGIVVIANFRGFGFTIDGSPTGKSSTVAVDVAILVPGVRHFFVARKSEIAQEDLHPASGLHRSDPSFAYPTGRAYAGQTTGAQPGDPHLWPSDRRPCAQPFVPVGAMKLYEGGGAPVAGGLIQGAGYAAHTPLRSASRGRTVVAGRP
jgi:hypothetical protein